MVTYDSPLATDPVSEPSGVNIAYSGGTSIQYSYSSFDFVNGPSDPTLIPPEGITYTTTVQGTIGGQTVETEITITVNNPCYDQSQLTFNAYSADDI